MDLRSRSDLSGSVCSSTLRTSLGVRPGDGRTGPCRDMYPDPVRPRLPSDRRTPRTCPEWKSQTPVPTDDISLVLTRGS